METIDEQSLGSEIKAVIKRARKTGQPVEITDVNGEVIARLVPSHQPLIADAHERARVELERLIEAITPYLPERVDAVEAIRDVRR